MLSAFPFLTEPEFKSACQSFLHRAQALESLHNKQWSSVQLLEQASFGSSILKITRVIDGPPALNREEEDRNTQQEEYNINADIEDEDDPEALVRTVDPNSYFHVVYDILLSPTYQVPVLYFVLRGSHVGPVDLESVYQYLVPDQYKKELKSVGVMGGISMGNHPESGVPAFFVHPCNTADAMSHVADPQNVSPEIYLLIWLGLVGNCVGLHMPRELFAR